MKSTLVPDAIQARRVAFGLYKGFTLNTNLRIQSQLYLGFWERETYNAIREAAPRADWFIDVGAGSGELCIFFASLEHVKRITAIEPNHPQAQCLMANVALNNIAWDRIEVSEKFAGNESSSKHVKIDDLNISQDTHGFMKIDVDGFELDVLRSGRQLLSHGNIDLLVETHSVELEENCIEFLKDLGYSRAATNRAQSLVFCKKAFERLGVSITRQLEPSVEADAQGRPMDSQVADRFEATETCLPSMNRL